MKSLILKDYFNIVHSLKAMMVTILIVTVCLSGSTGPGASMVMCTMMMGMLIISTMAMDEHCNWNRYALVMPVSKKDIILAKYIVLYLLVFAGIILGGIMGLGVELVIQKTAITSEVLLDLGMCAVAGIGITSIIVGVTIPLVIWFGVEKGRLFIILCSLVPAGIVWAVSELLTAAGIVITEEILMLGIIALPFVSVLWNAVMYRLSCTLFEKKEI